MSLVTVLVNRNCGHCVRAVDIVHRLAQKQGTAVAAVDVTAHPEAAKRLRVTSSPAVMFGDDVAYPGVPDPQTFQALCQDH